MGLSSLPTPSDGLFTLVLVNTAISFSFFKQIIRSILNTIGLNRYHLFDSDQLDYSGSSSPTTTDSIRQRFKAKVKAIRFGDRAEDDSETVLHPDCRVCLSRFEEDSMVNRLPCGHFFHAVCLEKWLDYNHVTCPLCRTWVLPAGCDKGEDAACPFFSGI